MKIQFFLLRVFSLKFGLIRYLFSQESEFFSKEGFPKSPFPNGWKGKAGLYAVGFTRRGLSGASLDAVKVSQDIGKIWKEEIKQKNQSVAVACHRRSKLPF